ncbi:MAG: hypothetical protein ACJ8FY_20525 [Gemmataceae bacterium]
MMVRSLSGTLLCLVILGAMGCGSDNAPETNGDSGDVSLPDLLVKPRSELAELSDEHEARVKRQEALLRQGAITFILLPELRFPRFIPVWQESKYSESAGFSLPPYMSEHGVDAEAALHVARLGDLEAANKLAGKSEKGEFASLDLERNYPLEWTRLVSLMQLDGEYRLAIGDTQGANELISLHQQLQKILTDKAKRSALGAALLGHGRGALAAAAPLLKKGKDPELAETIESALATWDVVPSPLDFLSVDASINQIHSIFGPSANGCAVVAKNTARALDLLELPVPHEGCQAVVGYFHPSGKLERVAVFYRPKISEVVPEASRLSTLLEEAETRSNTETGLKRLRRTYQSGGVNCEVTLMPHGSVIGGLVTFIQADGSSKGNGSSASWGPVSRDFGVVHLDRSFEQNRLRLAPEQRGDTVQSKRAESLIQIKNPLGATPPSQILVQRDRGQEGVARVIIRYEREQASVPLHQLALSLWQKYGPGLIEEVDDKESGFLSVVWQDQSTRLTLKLPHSENLPLELVAENARDGSFGSTASGSSFDQEERKARMKAGKPLSRLPRELEGVRLGQSRKEAEAALPQRSSVAVREFPGGLLATFAGDAPKTASSVVRQVVLRFDENNKLAEATIRYQRGPAANVALWSEALLKTWKKLGGAPIVSPSASGLLWSDLEPNASTLKNYSWQDDGTRMTFQSDGATADVMLLNCPVDYADGAPLPPLGLLPRGPEKCALSTAREDLLKAWQVTKPVTAPKVDLVLYPPKKSPYDALMIWFEGDRVTRILARHRPAGGGNEKLNASQLISAAWGRELRNFGWPNHSDYGQDQQLASMGNHDDRTRVRVYSQTSDAGQPRLYTEWKEVSQLRKASLTKP